MVRAEDHEAIRLLRSRNPRGFELAYATYAARLRAFLWRLAGRKDVADDLLQHTFLKLAERGPELRVDSDLHAWLFTVARNAYYSQQRIPVPLDEAVLEAVPSPALDVEARLSLGEVERALGELSSSDRELLLLIGAEGLSQECVAEMLEIEPAALRQRLSRARVRLMAVLERGPRRLEASAKGNTR